MRYLTVDGMLSGTGIRDSVGGGYVDLQRLGLSEDLKEEFREWLRRYEKAHYFQFVNKHENERLDREGVAICRRLQAELPDAKIDYYSNAEMRKLIVPPR